MGFQLNTCVALGYFVRIKTQKGAQLWLMFRQTGRRTDGPADGRTDSDRFVSPFLGNLFLLFIFITSMKEDNIKLMFKEKKCSRLG